MGRDEREWSVYASVSRHNDERDAEDDAVWSEMLERLDAIVDEYRDSPIRAI